MIDFDAIVLAPLAGVFGQPVTWQPAAGPPVAATGVFDANFREVKFTGEQDVVSNRPRLGCRAADLGGMPAEGDTFLIAGAAYTVSEPPLADSFGHINIFLHGPL
jgi:hypothetical protein